MVDRSIISPIANDTFKNVKIQKLPVAVNVSISNDKNSLNLDAVEQAAQFSPRRLIYNPIIFVPDQKITKHHKLLLAFYGLALGALSSLFCKFSSGLYSQRFS
jgi:hypothetical protein